MDRISKLKKFIGIVSLFPDSFTTLTSYGVIGRSLKNIDLEFFNPRDWAADKHRTVDEQPFGGGQGMLMKYTPLAATLDSAIQTAAEKGHKRPQIIYFSPQGRRFRQSKAQKYAEYPAMILLSGCYEGIDQRLLDAYVDQELSLGDYVLSSGDLPIMVFINSIARLWNSSLGSELSAKFDSFSEDLLEENQYTRPARLGKLSKFAAKDIDVEVPPVLSGGNHQKIKEWKRGDSLVKTWRNRPDLLKKKHLSIKDKKILLKNI